MDIKDKVIVITGAGRGLGRAIALALGAQGATLALLDINRADLEATAALVRSAIKIASASCLSAMWRAKPGLSRFLLASRSVLACCTVLSTAPAFYAMAC